MNNDARSFLAALLNEPSPSGYEGPSRRIWCNAMKKVADEVKVDVHGNSIATLNPGGTPRVMLAGHIDELGFQICHIEKNGMLRFRTIGGHDLKTIPGRRVFIYTESGPILAVIGQKPIHLQSDKTRAIPVKMSDLWMDAGFETRAKAEKVIQIGDAATYVEGYAEINKNIAIARGFDDRVGAFVVGETLRALKRTKSFKAQISAVATVQEEIGMRGAKTSAFGLDPDVGIAVDVAWATDNPGGEAKEVGEVKLGKGPVLSRGPNMNPALFSMLK
ncbi:MAG: M42 family peptidase, partial [Pseudomonadota bacterium]